MYRSEPSFVLDGFGSGLSLNVRGYMKMMRWSVWFGPRQTISASVELSSIYSLKIALLALCALEKVRATREQWGSTNLV